MWSIQGSSSDTDGEGLRSLQCKRSHSPPVPENRVRQTGVRVLTIDDMKET